MTTSYVGLAGRVRFGRLLERRHGVRVERLDGHPDADLLPPGRDELGALAVRGRRGRHDHLQVDRLALVVEPLAARVELVARRVELLRRDVEVECPQVRRIEVPQPTRHGRRDDRAADDAMAAEDLVHERRLVDGVAERIAERHVPHRTRRRATALDRRMRVEDEVRERVRLGGDGRFGDDDVRLALERVELVGGHVPGVVDVAGLERLGHRAFVLEELDEGLVLVRLRGRAQVVRVADEADVLTGLPLDRLVRAGADDRHLVRVGVDVALLPDVLREDRQVRGQDLGVRVVGREDQGLRVRRADRVDGRVGEIQVEIADADVAAVALLDVEERLQRPARVLGGRGRPVGPLQVRVDLERPGVPVLGPRLGEAADRLGVQAEVDEALVVEAEHLPADVVLGQVRVHRVEVLDGPDPQDDRVGGADRGGCGERDDRDESERDEDAGQAAAHRRSHVWFLLLSGLRPETGGTLA